MSSAAPATHAAAATEPRLPPITEVAVASLVCVAAGVIYLASYLPKTPSLGPAVGLLVAAGALVLANVVMLARLRDFAWDKFFLVAQWTALAYVVIAGMLEYVFIHDGTRGGTLAVMTLLVVLFVADVTTLIAFTVARFQKVGEPES